MPVDSYLHVRRMARHARHYNPDFLGICGHTIRGFGGNSANSCHIPGVQPEAADSSARYIITESTTRNGIASSLVLYA
jgi:hypothetical protein